LIAAPAPALRAALAGSLSRSPWLVDGLAAEGLALDEEDVVGGAALGADFTDGDSAGGGEIDGLEILNSPACRPELAVDGVAGFGFGCRRHVCPMGSPADTPRAIDPMPA
jgi:hypothetical protein